MYLTSLPLPVRVSFRFSVCPSVYLTDKAAALYPFLLQIFCPSFCLLTGRKVKLCVPFFSRFSVCPSVYLTDKAAALCPFLLHPRSPKSWLRFSLCSVVRNDPLTQTVKTHHINYSANKKPKCGGGGKKCLSHFFPQKNGTKDNGMDVNWLWILLMKWRQDVWRNLTFDLSSLARGAEKQLSLSGGAAVAHAKK
jgi:hypothetical protein